jgi:hypothetical protein
LGDVLGDDELEGWQTVGAARRKKPKRKLALPPKAAWRRQIAPGVPTPGQAMQPLPIRPPAAVPGGVFTPAHGIGTFEFFASPQTPFRAERLLVTVRRRDGDVSGETAGITVLATGIFIGRNLQNVERGDFDIEFYSPQAFGVRLALDPAQPGVDIVIPLHLSAALVSHTTANGSITVSMQFLGRSLR